MSKPIDIQTAKTTMLTNSLSENDLRLLGYSDIAEDRAYSDTDSMTVYRAVTPAGLRQVSARFVHAKSKCTGAKLAAVLQALPDDVDVFVIVTKATRSRSEIAAACAAADVPCLVREDLLWKKTSTLFNDFLQSLVSDINTERYFVQPHKRNDAHSELDKELLSYLCGDDQATHGRLRVLSAPAGVGKTTLARVLTVRLAEQASRNKLIPIYVEAQHWSKLRFESIDELWDVISNSLSMFSPTLSISEDLFAHMLQQGLVCFIFDGFDELCGHRQVGFRASEVLQQLAALALQSDARMLLTTRTAYWVSEIQNVPENVDVVELASFNTQQAKGYFAKFFKKSLEKQDRAFTLYSELIRKAQPPSVDGSISARLHFANLPLCVGIVAQCVERERTTTPFSIDLSKGLLWGVLYQLCEREQERQPLNTGAQQQLTAFEELTIDIPESRTPEFDSDLLGAAGFSLDDLPKLISHPLLRLNNEHFRFAYDFLPSFFRAVYLARFIEDTHRPFDSAALSVMTTEANGKGVLLDHLREIVQQPSDEVLRSLVKRLPSSAVDERSFLFHLFGAYASEDQTLTSKTDRSNYVFNLLSPTFPSNNIVSGIHFLGKLERFDLSNITFHSCHFMDSSFVECTANEKTHFISCSFSGDLEFIKSFGWNELPDPEHCTFIPPANLAWENHTSVQVGSLEDSIKDTLRFALSKFWKHGRWKATRRKSNWNAGPLAHSRHREEVLAAMLSEQLLLKHHISGVSEGGYLFDKDSVSDLQRFMDSRQMTGKIAAVYEKVLEKATARK